ncbi:MAG: MarR family winged helix-turn-helix transcriptional regulator [Oligoflexales bacterium]
MDAHKEILCALESALQKEGFTVPRFQIMFHLYFEGPLPPSRIAEVLSVTRGNITAFLKRLTIDNIVKTVPGKSEGRPKYTLTTKGKREFEAIFPGHASRVMALVLPMTADAIEQLKKIQKHAEEICSTVLDQSEARGR